MNLTYFVVVQGKTKKFVKVPAENIFQAFAQALHLLQQKGFNIETVGNLYTLPSYNGGYPLMVKREKWIEEEVRSLE